MRERSDRLGRAMVVAVGLVGVLGLGVLEGCAKSRRVDPMSSSDRRRAEELGLSAEAEDPTARDRRAGYGIWREKPETEGTRDPTTPERRNLPWD